MNAHQTTEAWRRVMTPESYRETVTSQTELKRVTSFSRLWRRIFRHLPPVSLDTLAIFEAGCGGGKHLAPFAYAGARISGLDCSEAAILNARQLFVDIERISGKNLSATLECGDFFVYNSKSNYDIVFHSGVIEHFLDAGERIQFLRKMTSCVVSGGTVVSIVPNGCHPLRGRMKKEGLGGYLIPEIDYTPELMHAEFEEAGLENVTILAHNLFDYLTLDKPSVFARVAYIGLQLLSPNLFPLSFSSRHAGTLIALGTVRR